LADAKSIVWDVWYRDVSNRLVCKRGFRTKAAARDHLSTVLPKVADGTWARIVPVLVKDYVPKWVESRQIKPSSQGAYRSLARKVVAVLGDREVGTLVPSDINALLAHYGSQRKKTRKNLLTFVRAVLADAVADRHAAQDPSHSRSIQKPRAVDEDDTGEIEVMVPEEVGRLLDAAEEAARPLFHCLAATGCRLGEALSLQWSDADLIAGVLHVRRTAYKGRFYAPKSQAAIRAVDLGDQAVAMLAALKRERFGEAVPPEDALIFPGRHGGAQDPASLRRGPWARALRKARLPYKHPHTLRHTYVSMLIEAGEDLAYIAKQVGHSNEAITATVYAKLLKPRRRSVATAVEARLGRRDNVVITEVVERLDTGRHSADLKPREFGQRETA
jgi:integrase